MSDETQEQYIDDLIVQGSFEELQDYHLKRLSRALNFATGFSLFFAVSHPRDTSDHLQRLEALLPEKHFAEVGINSPSDKYLRRMVLERLSNQDNPPIDVVSVRGFENWLSVPNANGKIPSEDHAFYAALNYSRSLFVEQIPCPLIFWVNHALLPAFQRNCPDFFSIRRMIAWFPVSDVAKEVTEREIDAYRFDDSVVASALAPTERQERIASLKNALEKLRTFGGSELDKASIMERLSVYLAVGGKYQEAETLAREALDIRQEISKKDHPDTATSLNNLALLYYRQGRYAEVEPLCLRALEITEKALGTDHPDTATSLNNLAYLYHNQGRYAEVEPLYLRALEIKEKVLGTDHPSTANSLNNLATLYKSQGRYGEAEPLYLRALEIHEKVLGANHSSTATSLNNLAGLYRNQGRYGEAEPLYLRALEVYEKVLGTDHPYTATSINNLAYLYQRQGRYGEAEPLYLRALEVYEKVLGKDHPNTNITRLNLINFYKKLGKEVPEFLLDKE